MKPTYKRRIRLIRPRLQLRLIMSITGVAVLALALQYMVFMRVLASVALALPNDGAALMTLISAKLLAVAILTLAMLLPAALLVGVLVTHRIAGPIYRFEVYLKQVLAGTQTAECRLREGDELQDLCVLINQVTEPLRAQHAAQPPDNSARRVA